MTKAAISKPASSEKSDAIVVGGGLAGLVAAYALAKSGLDVIHLAPLAPPDTRTSALMTPSVKIMQDIGLVKDPKDIGVPLEKIRIIDATNRLLHAPEALFESTEVGEAAFGWNFSNTKLLQTFTPQVTAQESLSQLPASAEKLTKTGQAWEIKLSNGNKVVAPLIIGADGKNSFVRQSVNIALHKTQHKQSALVCDLTLERPLNGESVEYHYPNGPFTLVPAGGLKANLVWVDNHDVLQEVKQRSQAEILNLLQEKSQNLFGKIHLDSGVFVFPLSSHHVDKMGQDGVVLVGESGHAFPPIGAQGLNLSLRDVSDLIACLNDTSNQKDNKWAEKVSIQYHLKRAADIRRTSTMVDTLFKSLLTEVLPAQAMRAGGIWALKSIPPLRKFAFQMGMGAS